MHGGVSTGPRTPEGRQRLAELGRARYVTAALAEGWELPTLDLREAVAALKAALSGSQNATARALGATKHDVRRVLARLPGRPEVMRAMESRVGTLPVVGGVMLPQERETYASGKRLTDRRPDIVEGTHERQRT